MATDLTDSYRAGISPDLDHARRVADPFHVVRVANRCVYRVRRRVQNETLAHRGRKKVLLDKAIVGCRRDDVEEIPALGETLARWRSEILAYQRTGASNGPTEGLNLLVKKVKRCGHDFRSFEHYRLRVLLHAGAVTWPQRPSPPRIRTRTPHSNA